MEKFLEKHNLSKWTQNELENLNVPISIKEIKFVIKNLPQRKLQFQMTSLVNSTKHLGRNNNNPNLHSLRNRGRGHTFQFSF